MSTFFKRGAVALLALAVLVLPVLLTACNKIKLADYPAIPTSFAYETDGNATVAQAGTDFEMPLNPSRGMRGETYLTLGSGGEAFPSSGDDAMRRLDAQLEFFAGEGITLMQVYIYLTNYCNDPLPESALEELKTYMTAVRERGVKMLIRFAYEYSESNKKGPRTRDIIGHCEQLKSFFEQNAELFDDTVYAVQLGMIGLWGEGHSSVHSLNERKIIKAVADMVPDDVFVMVRTPELLTKVPEEEEARFSVHDDYLVGRDDEWGMMDWSDPEYAKLLRKCKFALTDGEMPWGDQSPDDIDMLGVVGQAVGYGLTSLSIEHNYVEDGAEYLLKKWQSEYLTPGQLDELGYPYNPYLVGERISVFDYLRHHLGYQLAASDLRTEGGRASFMLTNYGFAAAHGFKIGIYAGGRLVAAEGDPDLGTLTAFGQRVFSFDYDGGDIEVKIFSVRDPDAVVRLYNEVPFESGRNVICRT